MTDTGVGRDQNIGKKMWSTVASTLSFLIVKGGATFYVIREIHILCGTTLLCACAVVAVHAILPCMNCSKEAMGETSPELIWEE